MQNDLSFEVGGPAQLGHRRLLGAASDTSQELGQRTTQLEELHAALHLREEELRESRPLPPPAARPLLCPQSQSLPQASF